MVLNINMSKMINTVQILFSSTYTDIYSLNKKHFVGSISVKHVQIKHLSRPQNC